jgi:GAF domain-containing protein
LYYVGLFLTDTNQEWAVLRAGTGEAGQAMLRRGHRIQVGSGMIGWCIANAQPRIAQAAEQDAVRLATAELPETRSEAALPLRSRGQVLGAISVQSSRPGAFDEQTVRVLQTMADQVAIALDNAILFMQSQASLEAERRAVGRIGRESWEKIILTRRNRGYRLDGHKISPVQDEWKPEMAGAAQDEHPVQYGQGHLAIPVKMRGDTIAVLDLCKPEANQRWSDEEIAFVGNLAEQLGTALESARLFEETEQMAERERLIGEITSRMRAVPDIDTVLQSAARDMRRALNLAEVEVRMGVLEEQPIEQTQDEEITPESSPTSQHTWSNHA